MNSAIHKIFIIVVLLPYFSATALAADDIYSMGLEQLLNVQVVSVSKKSQSLLESAAAVHVISQEDIRRSGATSLPEVLRGVPGVQVAQIDANKWAVSIRGFNDRISNKLLVMVDGRSVYTPYSQECSGICRICCWQI